MNKIKLWQNGPNQKAWAIHSRGSITLSWKDKMLLMMGKELKWSLCLGVIAYTDEEGRLEGSLDSVIYYSKVMVSETNEKVYTQEAVFDSKDQLHNKGKTK